MTAVLRLEFPWGRYHATPWGRNVNEGLPEWPPSPWRVLRALFATWKTRCAHLRAEDVTAALSQLAGLPTIHAPAMKSAHLRHYMPQIAHRSVGKPSTTITFDPFAVMNPREPIFIEWDVDMSASPRKALEHMADALSYLGRSESICNAALVSRVEKAALASWRPAGPDDPTDAEILCASRPFELSDLLQDPDTVRKNGRLFPTGSRLVPYTKTGSTEHPTITNDWRPTYAAVRFAVHPRPRPLLADAVAVGDLLRRAALRKHNAASATLSGKRASGDRRLDGHRHAHYLSLPHRGRLGATAPIDSVVVWAPGHLNGDELAALAQVRWLRAGQSASGVPDIALAVTGFGEIGEVAPEVVGPSSEWISRTPFCPGRHGKKLSWSDHVRAEIERELSVYRNLPAPLSVTVVDTDVRRFRRYRLPPKETMGSSRRAAMVQIQFGQQVEGPIVLGSLCHFGLGLFVPAKHVQ
ncbi:MAG: type I-U CRISPR-associated protein Cas5/Cas6 [Acidimicrobiaceae bacterium]|nr:type I-U CRISPR-associated protein Cas5/Cas6 [Acidimicrobiaceae bacterium]MYE09178.1 type I-U CRISPR-associated protein Cas5/Cas6 [Acidimicrobiaceae bacterium]